MIWWNCFVSTAVRIEFSSTSKKKKKKKATVEGWRKARKKKRKRANVRSHDTTNTKSKPSKISSQIKIGRIRCRRCASVDGRGSTQEQRESRRRRRRRRGSGGIVAGTRCDWRGRHDSFGRAFGIVDIEQHSKSEASEANETGEIFTSFLFV